MYQHPSTLRRTLTHSEDSPYTERGIHTRSGEVVRMKKRFVLALALGLLVLALRRPWPPLPSRWVTWRT